MRKTLLTLLFAGLVASLSAQSDDYKLYMQNAADASVVFRGSQAVQYHFAYNGTPYWDGPAFIRGDIRYNDKMYYGLKLNIDAVSQTLLLKNEAGIAEVALSPDQYDAFTIGKSRFMRLNGKIYEFIWDGKAKVLKQVVKVQERDIDGRKSTQTGYSGNFDPNIRTVFIQKVKYYYIEEGSDQMKELKNKRAVLKYYKPLKREVSNAVFHAEKGERMPLDDYYRFVMQYVETR